MNELAGIDGVTWEDEESVRRLVAARITAESSLEAQQCEREVKAAESALADEEQRLEQAMYDLETAMEEGPKHRVPELKATVSRLNLSIQRAQQRVHTVRANAAQRRQNAIATAIRKEEQDTKDTKKSESQNTAATATATQGGSQSQNVFEERFDSQQRLNQTRTVAVSSTGVPLKSLLPTDGSHVAGPAFGTMNPSRRAHKPSGRDVNPMHVRGATVEARKPSGKGAAAAVAQASEAVLDYRGGDRVIPAAAEVRVTRADRKMERHLGSAVDDGDHEAFTRRQSSGVKRERSEKDGKKKAAPKPKKVARQEKKGNKQVLIDDDHNDDEDDDDEPDDSVATSDSNSDLLDDEEAEEDEESEDDFELAEEEGEEEKCQVCPGFVCPRSTWVNLLAYQQVGVRWLCGLNEKAVGGILGDEMGLGKTIQSAALIATLHASGKITRPVLIAMPLTVISQWVTELHKWARHLRTVVMHSSGSSSKSREEIVDDAIANPATVVITSYAAVTSHIKLLQKAQFSYVILDEGHKISNPEAGVTIAVKTLQTRNRIVLSGSPIQNTLKELWSIFDFVAPGLLGSLNTFVNEIETPIKQSRNANASSVEQQTAVECAKALKEHIAPYLLRRLKRDVNKMLPPKHERVIRCKLTDVQLQEYLDVIASTEVQDILHKQARNRFELGRLDRNGRSFASGGLVSGTAGSHLTQGMSRGIFKSLSDLRLICNHADIFKLRAENKEETQTAIAAKSQKSTTSLSLRSNKPVDLNGSGKLQALAQLLKTWKDGGHKALVFSQSRMMLDIIENFVSQSGYRYIRMDGTTHSKDRGILIRKFNNDDEIFVALLTTKVGGLGVNLTGANRVVIFDPDWNPVTDEQARERAWRIGQTREVCIYRMITSGTVEEHILHRQLAKIYVTEKVLSDPTLQRFFTVQSIGMAFKLGEEYLPRIGPNSRYLVSTLVDPVAEEVDKEMRRHDLKDRQLKQEVNKEADPSEEEGVVGVKLEPEQEELFTEQNLPEVKREPTANNASQTGVLADLVDGQNVQEVAPSGLASRLAKLSARRTLMRATGRNER